MTSARVPVLVLSGPVGAGKTTIGGEAAALLRAAKVPHALVDLAVIGQCWPAPVDDPWHEGLIHRNLACMWSNFRQAGAQRLIVCRVLEERGTLGLVLDAVPHADPTVVELRVPLAELHARIRHREAGDPTWYLDVATYLVAAMQRSNIADHIVQNHGRPPRDVAEEVLRVAGWR